MKAEIFTLCDYAAQYGESLCIFGIGETFRSTKSSYTLHHKFLAYRIRFESSDKGKCRISANIADDSGKVITAFSQGEYEPIKQSLYGFAPLQGTIYLEYVTLPKLGVYFASLSGNDEKLVSIPLFVVQSGGMS